MSGIRLAVLAIAVLAALAAAWIAASSIRPQVQEVEAPAPQIATDEVLVAARDLNIGATVSPGDLRWQEWPSEGLPPDYVTKARTPDAQQRKHGALVRVAVRRGEPVTARKVVDADTAGFMAARLAKGMRAVSAEISPETGAGGFILPGDRVDVILTYDSPTGAQFGSDLRSETVLTNVRVLAIDQTFNDSTDEEGSQHAVGKTATLELTPAQAETLAYAHTLGDIWLTLRSLADMSNDGPRDTGVLSTGTGAAGDMVTVTRYGASTLEQPRSTQ